MNKYLHNLEQISVASHALTRFVMPNIGITILSSFLPAIFPGLNVL